MKEVMQGTPSSLAGINQQTRVYGSAMWPRFEGHPDNYDYLMQVPVGIGHLISQKSQATR